MNEPKRERLPDSRRSMAGKASIAGHEFYVIVGFFDDLDPDHARPGEVFVKASKHGSDTSMFVDAWATAISVALQYGVPWCRLRDKFLNSRGGTFDENSPSFLHAIVRKADDLIEQYRLDHSIKEQDHEQADQESQDTASEAVAQPEPPAQEG